MSEEREIWKAAGKRLATARACAGYASQKAFADAVDLSTPTIAKYEQGVREIPISLLFWLSKRHGINADWIVSGDGDILYDSSKVPSAKESFDIVLLQQLHDTVQAVFIECKHTPPPRAITAEAGELYNELTAMVADIRDKDVVSAVVPILRERFKQRLLNAQPGSGKVAAS